MKIDGEIVENMLRFAQYRVILQEETYVLKDGHMEALTDHVILPDECTSSLGGCQVHDKTYVWKTIGHRCLLEGVRQVRVVKEGSLLIDHKNKIIFNQTGIIPSPAGCPTTDLVKTEYDDLFLSTIPTFPVTSDNLEIDRYINNRDNYLSYKTEQLARDTKTRMGSKICKQKYVGDEIIQIDQKHFGQIKGDVLYIFDCVNKVAKLMTRETCYDNIPIEGDNFVHPQTRVLTNTAAKTPCNKFFPTTIETLEGWVTINPHITPSATPQNMSIMDNTVSHEDMSIGGIYTDQELAAWESQLQFSNFHQAVTKSVSYGVCVAQDRCEEQMFAPSYDLKNLLKQEIEQVDIVGKINNWIN